MIIEKTLTETIIDDVIEAYEETGLLPEAGSVFIEDGPAGCALGALSLQDTGNPYSVKPMKERYGFSDRAISLFAQGFDSGFINPDDLDYDAVTPFKVGFEVGQAVRKM